MIISVLFAVIPVMILLGFGIAAILVRSTTTASICEAIAHGGFGLGGIVYLYFIVPQFKKLFEDFGAELPSMTMMLIMISDLVVNYWYILLFGLMTGITLDVLAFATFHRVPESRYVARIFSVIVTCGLLAHAIFAEVALGLSEAKLMNDLSSTTTHGVNVGRATPASSSASGSALAGNIGVGTNCGKIPRLTVGAGVIGESYSVGSPRRDSRRLASS